MKVGGRSILKAELIFRLSQKERKNGFFINYSQIFRFYFIYESTSYQDEQALRTHPPGFVGPLRRAWRRAVTKRILVVEDDETTLAVVMQLLDLILEQAPPLVARDGQEALHLAYLHLPDLILMDLSLPRLSGWEVTRSLRSDSRFNQTVILALTAHAMVGDRERALEAGCNGYLTKPIEVDTFAAFMRPYLV